MNKKVFLICHESFNKQKPQDLVQKIKSLMNEGNTSVWNSPELLAREAAKIIQHELQLDQQPQSFSKLKSYDYVWFKKTLDLYDDSNLIIVCHSIFMREFVSHVVTSSEVGFASGVILENDIIVSLDGGSNLNGGSMVLSCFFLYIGNIRSIDFIN